MSNIGEAIRQLAQSGVQTVSMVCTVDAVDKDARTVDCSPLDESAPLLGVNLQANQESQWGLVLFPKVGSFVVVGFVANGSAGVVLLTDEVESVEFAIKGDTEITATMNADGVSVKVGGDTSAVLTSDGITLNGGSFGGLVKVEDLTSRLNAIENDINSLKQVFSVWSPVAQDGGSALKANVASWAAQALTLTKRGDYENEKVKQ